MLDGSSDYENPEAKGSVMSKAEREIKIELQGTKEEI
jgi:hypothetical protein